MPEDTSHYDSLNEKSKQIDIALKFTSGDMEKAKLMTSGVYKDVKAMKGRFAIEESDKIYGIFFIFLNIPNEIIMNINTLLLQTNYIYVKANIFENWKTFYLNFENFVRKEGGNAMESYEFTNHLSHSMESQTIFNETEDLEATTAMMKEIIKEHYSTDNVECQVALEDISSLTLELEGIPLEFPGLTDEPEETEEIESTESIEDSKIAEIESQADYIINGRIIISPVKGKYINDINVGEKIKVLFADDDERSFTIARKLNGLSENDEFIPINARIKDKVPYDKGGFIIYGLVAKNVLIKIIEEENVKIEMDMPQNQTKTVETTKKEGGRLLIYIFLIIGGILILLSLIMMFI